MARDGGPACLSEAWIAWLGENVALGVADEDLLAALEGGGVPRLLAVREIAAVRASPLALGARRLALRLQRRELFARLQRSVASLRSDPRGVERRSGVSADEFHDRYYAGNLPVVLTDALAPWPRLAGWTPAYFKECFGDVEIEVMSGRDADPACDAHFEKFRAKTTLGAFCDRVTQSGPTNDFYLVSNNRLVNRPALRALLDDVAAPHPYLGESRDPGWTSIWFGPAGTVTPLHHDASNVLFCQVYGRKRLLLVPPFELALIDHIRDGFYSLVDPERVGEQAHPALEGISMREVVLSPGEALFLPVGWWHHARALDVSIGLAFTTFRAANRFDWYYPGRIGCSR